MTRKPNRSVAVAGAALPAPEESEAVEVEVVESVVELGLGEIDGDDMMNPLEQKSHRWRSPGIDEVVVRTEYPRSNAHIRKSYSLSRKEEHPTMGVIIT